MKISLTNLWTVKQLKCILFIIVYNRTGQVRFTLLICLPFLYFLLGTWLQALGGFVRVYSTHMSCHLISSCGRKTTHWALESGEKLSMDFRPVLPAFHEIVKKINIASISRICHSPFHPESTDIIIQCSHFLLSH